MSGMDWIKLSTSYLDNPTLGRLPENIRARFYELYLLAGQCDANGFITYSLEEIAWKLHINLEELQATMDLLNSALPVLFRNNGSGPEMPIFRNEQVSREKREEQKEQHRLRQDKYIKSHVHITDAIHDASLTTKSQSQSQSKRKSQSQIKKKINDSSSSSSKSIAADDDELVNIFRAFGATPKQLKYLAKTPGITLVNVMAMAAQVRNDKTVRKPNYITLQNILEGERAAAEWKDQSTWEIIPEMIRSACGLAPIQDGEKDPEWGENKLDELQIEFPIKPDESVKQMVTKKRNVERCWQSTLDQLQMEMPKASFDTWVRDTRTIHYEDGLFIIAARNKYARDWLESRLTSTVTRLLMGIVNRSVDIKFVVQEGE